MENNPKEEQNNPALLGDNSNALKVFPNPATELVNIEWQTEEDAESVILIYNHTGALLSENNTRNNTATINISSYQSGVYLIRVITGNKGYEHKLIKQ
jgi:hypothetical protein